jgi:hypothetical protein
MATFAQPTRLNRDGYQGRAAAAIVYIILASISAGMVVYSQVHAFAWDEAFHLLCAQLIRRGKLPYIDFCFSQTPFNAYWNALLMTLFGESWRPVHAAAALCSAAAVWLAALFVRSRFPVQAWRIPGAAIAALIAGLNILVVRYGGVGQAYGIGLVSVVAAYRLGLAAVDRKTPWTAAFAGLFCGVAAASSLLTFPAAPVVLVWILIYNRAGVRWMKLASFAVGVAVAFLPLFRLFIQGPRQVWFGIFQYNASYRQLNWGGATRHNLEIFASFINNGPALLLLLLAAGGLLFIYFRSQWDPGVKAEFYLCAWLVIGLAAFISIARPTFARYYVFTVPFLAILAVAGLYALASNLYRSDKPWLPVAILGALAAFGLAKDLYDERENLDWSDMEKVAVQVRKVTAPQQSLYADEAIYFLTRHDPPSGLEMDDSHKFDFDSARNALLHLIPAAELRKRLNAGAYQTTETCEDDDYIADHGLDKLYAKRAKAADCDVFWDLRKR